MKIGIYQSYWGRVGGGQRYIGVVADILARQHQVEIVHHCPDFDPAKVAEPMEVSLSAVGFRYIPRAERPIWATRNPLARLRQEADWGREISEGYDLFIDSSDNVPFFCHARQGVLLIHFPLVTFEQFHGHASDTWENSSLFRRVGKHLFHRSEWNRRFATYSVLLVNSEYTRQWTKKRWGLDGRIVYPPLRDGLRTLPKEPMILSIGAFSNSGHKKHEVLLNSFRELCKNELKGWRYVLVGACGDSEADRAYVARLKAHTDGDPIEIRTDLSGDELKQLLGTASILWHSMGYGVDSAKEPGRLEHFGMVATEAMASGCVPVVFDGGGLREIVDHGRNGFRWSTLDELKTCTVTLAASGDLRERLAKEAFKDAQQYSAAAFEERLLESLAPVLR